MTQLKNALKSWGSKDFKKVLKHEIEALNNNDLPLNQATCQGGIADDSNISALINSVTENDTQLLIKVGIFFNEIIAGCNCGDDPAAENTYCELLVTINKNNAESDFTLQEAH